jgi:hypothetical protein
MLKGEPSSDDVVLTIVVAKLWAPRFVNSNIAFFIYGYSTAIDLSERLRKARRAD